VRSNIFFKDRMQKVKELRHRGINPYPYKYSVSNSIKEVKENFNEYTNREVTIAGRVISIREHGKTVFMDLRDFTGEIQLYFRKNELQDIKSGSLNLWELLSFIDISDTIGVKGKVFKTKIGEITIWVESFEILAKALYSIPFGKTKGEKRWYAVEDPEVKYRERYIYWNIYPQEREKVVLRTCIIKTIREFMDSRGFLEVQAPTIEMIYGGAEARPFETKIWALGWQQAYLRISPELYLKRYIVAGFPKVYTICQNFRNEGIDKLHNPEFTMMEWYEAYTDYEDQMKQFEELVAYIVKEIHNSYTMEYQGVKLNFAPPWRRLRVVDVIKELLGFDIENATDDQIREFIKKNNIEYQVECKRELAIAIIFEEFCEDKLIQPTFIIDHPKEISPLTKEKKGTSDYVERFEPFVLGMEIGNAYSELTDPQEQLQRFLEQREMYKEAETQHHPIDYDFIKALACGMPPTGGVGLGIDRLIMILTNSESIRDVIPFSMIKPKKE